MALTKDRAARFWSRSGLQHRLGSGQLLFDRHRILSLTAIALAIELVLFGFITVGTYGLIVPLQRPASTDFVSFYAAGALADAGTPQLAYDRTAHYAAEERATQPGIGYNFFYYPPVFLLVCSALARAPYVVAFVAFEAMTLAFYVVVIRRILGECGWLILIPILAFPPVLWTIGIGQNGLLTAGLLGAGTLLVDRRGALAGLAFGALACKPHFGMLVPVALAASGRWRALAATVLSALGLSLVSLISFGAVTWHDFALTIPTADQVYISGSIPFSAYVTPFGAARLTGASPAIAGIVQTFVAAAVAAFVAYVWRRNLPLPIRAAALISGTLMAVPLALFYDLVLAGVAGAWLLRAEDGYRLPEWGPAALLSLCALSLNPRGPAGAWHLPTGWLVSCGLFALVVRCAIRGARTRPFCAGAAVHEG